jgi:hypothetical protein
MNSAARTFSRHQYFHHRSAPMWGMLCPGTAHTKFHAMNHRSDHKISAIISGLHGAFDPLDPVHRHSMDDESSQIAIATCYG